MEGARLFPDTGHRLHAARGLGLEVARHALVEGEQEVRAVHPIAQVARGRLDHRHADDVRLGVRELVLAHLDDGAVLVAELAAAVL